MSFGSRQEPGIQAADLWVRELVKRREIRIYSTNGRAPGRNGMFSPARNAFNFISRSGANWRAYWMKAGSARVRSP
jgi:hypothetical protein